MKLTEFSTNLLNVQGDLHRFALKLTTNREEADDLLQETSLRILDNKEKYTNNTNFKAWAYTVMRNLFINNYRKVVREQTFVDNTASLYHLNIPQNSGLNTPEGAYTVQEINKAILSLSDEYKTPFLLHIEGFKYEEIAEEISLPLGTVKSRIFFARQKLQAMLKDYR